MHNFYRTCDFDKVVTYYTLIHAQWASYVENSLGKSTKYILLPQNVKSHRTERLIFNGRPLFLFGLLDSVTKSLNFLASNRDSFRSVGLYYRGTLWFMIPQFKNLFANSNSGHSGKNPDFHNFETKYFLNIL